MKKILILLLFIGSFLSAGEINIAVSANVASAMPDLLEAFSRKSPKTHVRVTLASSGKLTAQIKNGAPYGLFMAANLKYPQSLYDSNFAITKPRIYAQGALAYFSTTKQDYSQGIKLLTHKDIHNIAIANPKTAPYGKAAIQAMKRGNVYDQVKDKLVYAETISQAFSYTVVAAEIGIISKSSLFSKKMRRYKEFEDWATVEPELYKPIEQGVVLLKNAKNNPEYKAFYDFLFSDTAKEIFIRFGYLI